MTRAVPYLTALLLSLLIVTSTMKLWRADFNVPFHYGLDALFYEAIIKGTIENGWYLQNDSLGAPAGLRMYDFPMPDAFNFLQIKLLAAIRSDYAWVINVFFLLTFPLATICSMFVFRQFNLSHLSAVVWSLLYTFIPFHFFPGPAHLFVVTYYVVPLVTAVALWVSSGELWSRNVAGKQQPRLNLRSRKFVISVIACLLISSVGLSYYAFFSCFFILNGGVIAAISQRHARHLLPAAILSAVIIAGLFANLAPNLAYFYRHGRSNVAQRVPAEAEVYGLKIATMLLPIRNHRMRSLAELTKKFSAETQPSEMGALGIIGSFGFLFLLYWLFFNKKDEGSHRIGNRSVLNSLSVMNAAAVLLAVVGGFSPLFALFISPQIRSYHRISVFIAFFSVLAMALLLEGFFRARAKSLPRGLRYVVLIVILVVGLLDQTNAQFVPMYARNKAEFANDHRFVSSIERALPAGAMVFQLPYVPFPESPPVNGMSDYELFRGYLHSHSLRWSYGAMKGREGDAWLRNVSAKPVPEMLEAIILAGFQGIYIDRLGYLDKGAALEDQLHAIVAQPPSVSDNQRLAFFDLTEFSARFLKNYSPTEWAAKRESVMHMLSIAWGGGYSDIEGTADNNWHWCSNSGELTITNPSPRVRKMEMEMELFSGYHEPSNIRIQGSGFSDNLLINNEGKQYSKVVVVPPGTSSLSFYCDGKRVIAPQDPRTLVFRVVNFRLKEVTGP